MPRRNRPARARSRAAEAPLGAFWPLSGGLGWVRTESAVDGEWRVRSVPGAQCRKTYRCPGCDQPIPPGTGHLVAWPVGDGVDAVDASEERRHWHTACWAHRRRLVSRKSR
jgi:hypothetical protein